MDGRAEGPTWIQDGARDALKELRSFVATGTALLRSPRSFAREWYRGERHALSPFACLATSAAVVAVPMDLAMSRLYPSVVSDSLVLQALNAVGPYFHYAALGVLAHGVLRLLGSKRSLQGSVGLAIFAGAIPGSASSLLAVALLVINSLGSGIAKALTIPMALVTVAAYVVFVRTLALGLAGLHDVRGRRAALAIACALVGTGLVFGHIGEVAGGVIHFGFHLSINVWRDGAFHVPNGGIIIP
jgi:hypothetical protein